MGIYIFSKLISTHNICFKEYSVVIYFKLIFFA